MCNPSVISDKSVRALSPNIKHIFKRLNDYRAKINSLIEIVEDLLKSSESSKRIIVFCRSDTGALSLWTEVSKYIANSDLSKNVSVDLTNRKEYCTVKNIFSYFKPPNPDSPKLSILIASDLYSRGLDFYGVSDVIHFDIALSISNYVHRCGRTGRFNEEGRSITLAVGPEDTFAAGIEKFLELEEGKGDSGSGA